MPAIEDEGIAPVAATEAILARPGLLARLEGLLESSQRPRQVLRMNAAGPALEGKFDFIRGVTEGGREIFVPPEDILPHVPVPNDVRGGARHQLEPLVALAQ